MKQNLLRKFWLRVCMLVAVILCGAFSNAWADTGTINFGNNGTKINSTSVTGQDDLNNTWTITTVMDETSFTQQPTFSQIGAAKKPATSITFSTTLPSDVNITAFSAKFGGFSGTEGTVTLKVGETTVGTGSLNGTNDVVVSSTSAAVGKTLTVTVTDIAKGVKAYYVSYTYSTGGEVNPVCEMPIFSPEAGAVTIGTTVNISSATENATIIYTTDGTTPSTTNGTTGTTVTINEATTIKAIAIKDGYDNSGVASASYTIAKVAKPTFSPEGGEVDAGTVVTISTTTADATIYYTIDGSNPTSSSTQGNTVTINENTTIKAIAVKNNMADSNIATANYTISGASVAGYNIDFEEGADSYTDWTFTNALSAQSGSIDAYEGTHYGTTGGKATASIQTQSIVANPGVFTCYVSRQTTNSTASTWSIQVSSDGSSWTDVKTQSATSMSKGNWVEFTADLSSYSNVYVRLYYSGSTAVRNVDDLSLTMASSLAAPIISLASGTYDEVKSVTITAETGATIYYTLDGSTPNTESTEYIGAISISRSCTLKAIAVKDGVSSNVASATYTLNVPLTIAEVREQGTGSVKTIGVVTSCVGKNVYIQDATAAILVYGKNVIEDLAIGDEILVSGTLSTYKGLLEITDPEYTKRSEGNTVTPQVMTVAQVNESENQGWLVKIENATVTEVDGNSATIEQNGENILVFGISSDVTLAVGNVITLTGNIGCFNTVQIANPRDITIAITVTVGSAGYTTYVTPAAVSFPDGVEAFIVTAINEGSMHMDKVTAVPANTPIVVKAAANTYELIKFAEEPNDVSANLLQASDGSKTGDGSTIYALGVGKTGDELGVVGFYKVKEGAKVPAGKAYIVVSSSNPVKNYIAFDFGGTDAINAIDNGQLTVDSSVIYNVAGQRVGKMTKGIYVVNGKKVIVK